MAKRYIPRHSFTMGRGRSFVERNFRGDGTMGYTEDEIKDLSKAQRASFQVVDYLDVVEEATAAPGELRTVTVYGCDVDECGFEAKSPAGLSRHKTVHDAE